MNQKNFKQLTYNFLIVLVALLLSSLSASIPVSEALAQDGSPPALFVELSASADVPPEVSPGEGLRTRYVQVDWGVLDTSDGSFTFNLFEDTVYTGAVERVESYSADSISRIGSLTNQDNGYFYIIVAEGTFLAHVASPEGVYEVSRFRDNVYRIVEVDQSQMPDHPEDLQYGPVGDVVQQGSLGPTADDGSIIDVMVLYTDDARAAEGSTENMNARIDLAVTEANDSYLNSDVTPRLNMVHRAEISYDESGGVFTDLDRLTKPGDGYLDDIHSLRNTYKADVVVLIVESSDYCGVAQLMADVSTAFAVVKRDGAGQGCMTGNYSFAHEIGHLQGAGHDLYGDPTTTPFAYGHGYVYLEDRWRTVMAYNTQCEETEPNTDCTRLKWWSNPNKEQNGQAMGVAGESENYRVLNETAYTVANFSTNLPAFPEPATPNTNIRNRRPRFTWTKVPGATQYKFQVKGGLLNVYTKTVDAGACGDTKCSNTPTDVLGYKKYQWRVQVKVGDTWRPWSAYKEFTVLKPDLFDPSGTITDKTPEYIWTKEFGATNYQIQLKNGLITVYTKTVDASGCAGSFCYHTPADVLGYKTYTWWVRAKAGNVWGGWSAAKKFTVVKTGFNSPFNSHMNDWKIVNGAWSIYNNSYLQTPGLFDNSFVSAFYNYNFGTLNYQVRMRRLGTCTGCANAIYVRGTPYPTWDNLAGKVYWQKGYYFAYANDGIFSVWVFNNGQYSALQNWAETAAVNQGGWNTLKVVAEGSSLKFYINNILVWTGNDSTLATGKVGIAMFRFSSTTGNKLYVDWATLSSTNLNADITNEQVEPGQIELEGNEEMGPAFAGPHIP